jgi:hypothetical protein
MNSILTKPLCYEFCFPEKDTLVLVEVGDEGVTVRATRDTFTEQRKASFVRELAAEGFIAETYRWFSSAGQDSYLGVQWKIDYSWLVISPYVLATARNFTVRLLVCSLLFWLGQMATLFAS